QVAGLELVEIPDEAGNAGRAQAPRQAAVDHLLLAVRQRDAGALVDHGPHAFEILAGEIELLDGVHFIVRHVITLYMVPVRPSAWRAAWVVNLTPRACRSGPSRCSTSAC